ncbi:hypothetical protein BGZ76_010126 [Entomortierella beljakovae]|nr:hypothetical protein BGZ76_010126 [Entomortierella beljakovae]
MRFHINTKFLLIAALTITIAWPTQSHPQPKCPKVKKCPKLKKCPKVPKCPPINKVPPYAHNFQAAFYVKDSDDNKVVTVANEYFVGKDYKINDAWLGAYYASYSTLPNLLKQYNVEISKKYIANFTERGAPLFADLVLDSLLHPKSNVTLKDYESVSVHLARRGIFDDIVDWFEDAFGTVKCGAFAAGGIPAFAAAAGIFDAINPPGVGFTEDQLFYVHAALGYVPSGISVVYGADFVPGFGDADGVAFLRSIYVRAKRNTVDGYPASSLDVIDGDFSYLTKLLVHEAWHVRQYDSHGFNLASFGFDYLYSYCRKSFSYYNNQYEVDARAVANTIVPMLSGTRGYFFKVWKLHSLKKVIGYPQSTVISSAKWAPTSEEILYLSFEMGILEIRTSSKYYRIFSGSDLQLRRAASCNPNRVSYPICHKVGVGRKCFDKFFERENALCRLNIYRYKKLYDEKPWIKI